MQERTVKHIPAARGIHSVIHDQSGLMKGFAIV